MMIFDCPECGHTLEHVGICDYYCEWCDDTYDIEELLPPVFDVVDDENA